MSNFELIDDYLTNRLSGEDKVQFEKQMASDADLQSEVKLQQNIVEGVKQARALELKAMLNQVPVPSGVTSGITAGKVAIAVIGASIVGTALYFYLKPESVRPKVVTTETVVTNDSVTRLTVVPSDDPAVTTPVPTPTPTPKVDKSPKKDAASDTKSSDPEPRKIEVTDPSGELVGEDNKEANHVGDNASATAASKIVVETLTSNKKYNFNYQFADGKLILYGPFDKALYEILEIHGDHNTIFLYYKDNYYLLDEKQAAITPLTVIRDANLIKKLKEYRGN